MRGLLELGFKLFPKREDFQFVATGGKSGRAPAGTSHAFPWTGHYVMRSGWEKDATFLLFDSGPYGYSHQHEDKLHFVLWSHGRQLVLDPGNFSYDRSRWRRYVLSTAGHNTVMVDGQNQHRRGKRDTYFWPRPWTTPKPAGNDTTWTSTPEYDLAIGTYSDGYGDKNEIAVTHQRRVVFLKKDRIFVITDTHTPKDDAEHRYDALFHLDPPEASMDESTKTVRFPGLSIVPAASESLTVDIVKGKEDEPVQGWASGPWRAVPTAIYRQSGRGTMRFNFVLEPLGKENPARVRHVKQLPDGVVRVEFTDGSSVEIAQSAANALRISDTKP